MTIGAALGDLQCSVLATMQKPDDAVLNLSTSAQLAFVMPPHFEPNKQPGMTNFMLDVICSAVCDGK